MQTHSHSPPHVHARTLQDMVIFMGLLNDLFPGVDPPRKRDMDFERVIVETTESMGLTAEEDFVLRVVQVRACV